MSLVITGKNFKLNSAIKEYVTKQMNKVTKYTSMPINDMKVELDIDKNQQSGLKNRVEVSVELLGKIIKAGHKAENMREAIDLCMPKLIRQIKKYKGIRSKTKQPGSITIRINK
ncbi:ribosome-associated translation inhibitor RaiA [Patescibacteria group bacterium]|nr:ribosome-associated translation inhibitor RaiA [Patescibacteria group bacterium]MBU0964092.1 ribosome-associated translation inhibitor RaiA [Patescibacteria group bacterium]